MVEQAVFRAIADPTRREIMGLLSTRDMNLNEIANNFDMTRPAVAKHLRVLRDGRLISVRQHGRERIHSLTPETLKTVADWLSYYDQFWDDKLSNLKRAVEADND
ncbi:MAG: metalloregulator ArsR/SmtB family transcription factor [Henriciella sp.]|nr:metalloregulator ArsR/SmtB family transcription factor [Henriciella sp.]